jgi:hypothetical protein
MIWRISWRSSFMVGFFRRISWWTQSKIHLLVSKVTVCR